MPAAPEGRGWRGPVMNYRGAAEPSRPAPDRRRRETRRWMPVKEDEEPVTGAAPLGAACLVMEAPQALSDTFRVIDLCGVLLNGVLGGLIARRKNFDLVGFIVLAILTATGGGILRDVMIQAGPPLALTDPYYLYAACLGAAVAWFVPMSSRWARRLLVVADAVILGCWAATGASKALSNGLGVMPAVLLGCLTAVGGSMIRDVAVGETPAVFGGNKLYAVPALVAAITQVGAVNAGLPDAWAMVGSTLIGAGLCLLAYWRSWKLPVITDLERRRRPARSAPPLPPDGA